MKGNVLFKLLMTVAATIVLFCSCATQRETTSISYIEGRNYFFLNGAKVPSNPLITSEDEFNSLFGAATTMGRDGQPTDIDFARQAVIAIVLPQTDRQTEIKLGRLVAYKDTLTLNYKVVTGEKQTYTVRPMAFVVVDKKYCKSTVKLEKQGE